MNSSIIESPAASKCRQNWAMGMGILEMIISLTGLGIYTYSYLSFPMWREVIPLPSKFINDQVLLGLITSSALVCVLEFVMAILLFDGARRKRIGAIRTWLISMCTYMTLTVVITTGLYSSGIKSPELDAFICFTQFIRVLIILPVYAFLEDENMRRMKKCATNANNNEDAHCSSNGSASSNTISRTDFDPHAINTITILVTSSENETDSESAAIISNAY